MPKTTITIFTQARKWSHVEDFSIEHSTTETESSEHALYITLAQQEVEIDDIEINKEKLTVAHIDYLRGLKTKVLARAELDIKSLDDQINSLLCLENNSEGVV